MNCLWLCGAADGQNVKIIMRFAGYEVRSGHFFVFTEKFMCIKFEWNGCGVSTTAPTTKYGKLKTNEMHTAAEKNQKTKSNGRRIQMWMDCGSNWPWWMDFIFFHKSHMGPNIGTVTVRSIAIDRHVVHEGAEKCTHNHINLFNLCVRRL